MPLKRTASAEETAHITHTDYASPKTSSSHPLQIAEVQAVPNSGLIGITFCPGKIQRSAYSGTWHRDLDLDLDVIRNWNASAVISLIEDHELTSLQVEAMGQAVRARHMDWFHLPIADMSVPDHRFETLWAKIGPMIRFRLRNGFNVLVHCKGGLGRAGTIAAKLLVEQGMAPVDATKAVRRARSPHAIETGAQEAYVLRQRSMLEPRPSREPEAVRDRAIGALVGLAMGDAVGTTLEFRPRDSYQPLADMIGGGPFQLNPGQWTDDTAMALALADSLLSMGQIDEADLMRRFVDWRDNGFYSCTGTCFDVGTTTSAALDRWMRTGDPVAGSTRADAAGNGSLMRLAPVALRYWDDRDRLRDAAARQSRTTHAADEAVDACVAYAELLADVIAGCPLGEVIAQDRPGSGGTVAQIMSGSWRHKARQQVASSGYVAHSLEAALWSVARTGNYADAVLTAANLGGDADTTAAIAGQLAGAAYGYSALPEGWRHNLAWGDRIVVVADRLLER